MRVGSKNDEDEEIIDTKVKRGNKNNFLKHRNQQQHIHQNQPIVSVEDCENCKQVSDQKVIQGFFLNGIQQYFESRLDRSNVDIQSCKPMLVYVKETHPEILISDGE